MVILNGIFLNPKPHATGGAPDRFYPFYPGTCIGLCQCQLRLFVENSRALPGCPGVTLLGEANVLPKSDILHRLSKEKCANNVESLGCWAAAGLHRKNEGTRRGSQIGRGAKRERERETGKGCR